MRTRSQSRRRRQQVQQTFVEPFDLEKPNNNQEPPDPPVVTMADNRTMAEMLQAPTEGYEDAIVVPAITTDNFELKHSLLTLVQNKQFFGHDKEDPHAHIRYFNKITSTMKFPNVPSTSVKLMLFPFSLEGQPTFGLKRNPLGRLGLELIIRLKDEKSMSNDKNRAGMEKTWQDKCQLQPEEPRSQSKSQPANVIYWSNEPDIEEYLMGPTRTSMGGTPISIPLEDQMGPIIFINHTGPKPNPSPITLFKAQRSRGTNSAYS
ncbi:hypothetical protein Tco_0343710 [Tanacetum coccineum]